MSPCLAHDAFAAYWQVALPAECSNGAEGGVCDRSSLYIADISLIEVARK